MLDTGELEVKRALPGGITVLSPNQTLPRHRTASALSFKKILLLVSAGS